MGRTTAAFRHFTMGNIPVLHEVQCSFGSLGDVITGKPAAARQRWHVYAEESFFGSGVYAAAEASRGRRERARELGKGMGRATGKIICGGGVLLDLPVLHELATCGESLGDMIGGGDDISAAKRWASYAEASVVGSSIYAAVQAHKGNTPRAHELRQGALHASKKAGVTGAATAAVIGVTIASAGAAVPVAIAAGAATGGAVGAAATAGVQAIDGKVNPGDVVGSALFGATAGAIAGGVSAASRGGAIRAAASAEAEAAVASRLAVGAVGSGSSESTTLEEVRSIIRARRIGGSRKLEEDHEGDVEKEENQAGSMPQCKCPPRSACVPAAVEPHVLSHDVEMECSICLEEERDYPGIHGNNRCIHGFHLDCIEVSQKQCLSKGEPFTCPECRVAFDGAEWHQIMDAAEFEEEEEEEADAGWLEVEMCEGQE